MRYLKSLLTITLLCFSVSVIFSQTTKDYFTEEGLSINAYHYNFFDGLYSTSYTYVAEEIHCDLTMAVYYSNVYDFKRYFHIDGNKVYTVDINSCQMYLVYDFGLEAGDLITDGIYNGFTVDNVTTATLLNGEERVRIDLSTDFFGTSWIEGIGDINFGLLPYFADFEGYDKFICAKKGEELLWEDELEGSSCDAYSCARPKVDFEVDSDDFTITTINKTIFGTSYEWDFGDGNTSTEANPEHVYENPGCYKVTLNAKNDCYDMYISETKAVAVCTRDAWENDYFIDGINSLNIYQFSDELEFAFSGNLLLRSTDGGQSWVEINLPSVPEGVYRFIGYFQMLNQNDGVIGLGHYGAQSDESAILVTHDGGLTWEEKVEGSYFITALATGSNGEIYVSRSSTHSYYFRSLDYGYTWETIDIEPGFDLYSFNQVDQTTLYGVAYKGLQPNGEYYRGISYDKGTTWTFEQYDHEIYSGQYFDPEFGYTIKDGNFYITQNAGYDWTLKDVGLNLIGISFNSPMHGWVIDIDRQVYYTEDGLDTYQPTNCGLGRLSGIRPVNDTVAYSRLFETETDGTQKVVFNKNKVGDCFLVIDNDGDGYLETEDCDDDNANVNPGMQEIIGNMIDDDCDGEIDEIDTSVEEEALGIVIYPNPASTVLYVKHKDGGSIHAELIDVHGRVILRDVDSSQLDVSGMSRGVYFVRVYDDTGQMVMMEKVVLD